MQCNAIRTACQQLAGQRPLRFGPLGPSQRRGQPSLDVPFAETGTPDVYEATEPSYVAQQLPVANCPSWAHELPFLADLLPPGDSERPTGLESDIPT